MLRIPVLGLVYFCMATVLAEVGLLAAVAAKNGFDRSTLLQLVATAHEVDLYAMWKQREAESRPIQSAQVSHDEVVARRQEISLNFDLREIATEKGIRDIHALGILLDRERARFAELRDEYYRKKENLDEGAADQALVDMQRKLQAMKAQQAKDQIGRFLEAGGADYERSLQVVVTIIKAMPLEKRKKILAEFKDPEDAELLHEILRRIRLGVPNVELIRQTRAQLEQFKNRQ